MRNWLFILYFLLSGTVAWTQDVTGFWNASVDLMGQPLRIVFELVPDGEGISGIMRSPDQGGGAIPITSAQFSDQLLSIRVESIGLHFEGSYDAATNRIPGSIKQRSMELLCVLQRDPLDAYAPERPQTPEAPFPYKAKDLVFSSGDERYRLHGTLTVPEGEVLGAVVLITGSGPQDRDSEILGHRPFLVWADLLSRNGIAVLRFDERGVAASEGDFSACTSDDFALDALAALRELKKTFPSRAVGLMGHSEGGLVAAMAAAKNPEVDFVVSLAGTGLPGPTILETQTYDISIGEGMTPEAAEVRAVQAREIYALALEATDSLALAKALEDYFLSDGKEEEASEDAIQSFEMYNAAANNPWMLRFLRIDPREYWSGVACPILAVNGDKDLQVQGGANLRAISFAVRRGGNTQVQTKLFAEHNHLFQQTETGAISEYGKLNETLSEEVSTYVIAWMKEQMAREKQ